jgi:RloB-like protein
MSRRSHRQPPPLTRRGPRRDPKVKITIVCEGKITEPQYFSELARYCGSLVSVNLIIERGAGVPLSILKKARELLGNPADDFGQSDQVWAVFDRDEHPEVDRAIDEAHAAGISVAHSNPCFELWLVLHFRDYDAPVGRREIQRLLRSLMPGYDPRRSKQIAFSEICDQVEFAERRAEAMDLRRARERNARGNPCSSAYKLTREIRKHGRK